MESYPCMIQLNMHAFFPAILLIYSSVQAVLLWLLLVQFTSCRVSASGGALITETESFIHNQFLQHHIPTVVRESKTR